LGNIRKRVLVCALMQESNSFSPRPSVWSDFHIVTGPDMLAWIAAAPVFAEAGIEMVPTLYAYSVPGGILQEESYLRFKRRILDGITADSKLDGVWLYLHGALEVERVGSGEADLVSAIRRKVGPDVPIAVALDFHANNTQLLMDNANIVYGYRTAPHIDEVQTQEKTARLLIRCMEEGLLPHPFMMRPPLLFPGEMATTCIEPLLSLMQEVARAESAEGILCASFFDGMAWVDAPNSMASIVVVEERGTLRAEIEAKRLAGLFWDEREQFRFEEETADPEEAVRMALADPTEPVFITDSGDNVTAGAPGDSAYYLKLLLSNPPEHVLVAGIVCKRGVDTLSGVQIGAAVSFNIGGEMDPAGVVVPLAGWLKWKGRILDKSGDRNTEAAVVVTGGIHVIMTVERCSFVTPEIIESTGLRIKDFKIVIVKQGYLYDALRQVTGRSIMALTPGSASQDLSRFIFKKLQRPIFPLDRDFSWEMDAAE